MSDFPITPVFQARDRRGVVRRSRRGSTLRAIAGLCIALAVAIAGGVAWGWLTFTLGNIRVPWMSVGMGTAVGFSLRGGHWKEPTRHGALAWGCIGGGLALAGSVWGNLLSCVAIGAQHQNVSAADFLGRLFASPDQMGDILLETFVPFDLLFYGIAAVTGFLVARRPVIDRALACETSQPAA